MVQNTEKQAQISKLKWLYIVFSFLNEPVYCMYKLLPFIILEMFGSETLSSVFISIKPITALLCPIFLYVIQKFLKGTSNQLIFTTLLSAATFSMLFFRPSAEMLFLAAFVYYLVKRYRSIVWQCYLKDQLNFSDHSKGELSVGFIIYLVMAILVPYMSYLIQYGIILWNHLIVIVMVPSVFSTLLVAWFIETKNAVIHTENPLHYINDAVGVLKTNHDFRWFHIANVCSGSALMLIDVLIIGYIKHHGFTLTDYAIVIGTAKALGYFLGNMSWRKFFHHDVYRISAVLINFLFLLYGVMWSITPINIYSFCLIRVLYGIAQSGSQLSWNMSSAYFGKTKKEVVIMNVVSQISVGLRGLVFPILGGVLASNGYFLFGFSIVIWLSFVGFIILFTKLLNVNTYTESI